MIAAQIRTFQLETVVINMSRFQIIVFSVLLSLYCILQAASSVYSVELQEHVANEEASASDIFNWNCVSNFNCTVNTSRCINGTCQCPSGYIYNTNMTSCIKVATTYGDDCEESIQCSRYLFTGGICMNSVCVCAEGYYYMHGRCNAYSGLFERCNEDVDCYVTGDFQATRCENGICKCSQGYYLREYRTCRPKAKAIGDKCVIDNDCKQFNNMAYCEFDNTCVLKNTTAYLRNNILRENENQTAISIDSNCIVNEDCAHLGNASCGPSNTCICNRASFFFEEVKKCIPELGEPCQKGENPVIEYSECRNERWSCELDKAVSKNNRKCEKVIKRYDDNCKSDIQCFAFGPDAICKNRCVCNDNSRFNEAELFCWTKRGIGEECQQDIDCYINATDVKLTCTGNLCSCPNGTYPNSNRTDCVNLSPGIGLKCEVENGCAPKNSKCDNNICVCIDNYYEMNNQCVAGVNATCSNKNDCKPKNSECTENRCSCQGGYVASSVSSCLPAVPFGKSCDKDVQCSNKTANSVCSTINATEGSVCICAEGYHYNFQQCYERKVLGMKCQKLGECYLDYGDRVVCKNGRCSCDWDYIQLNDTACESIQRYNANGSSVRNAIGLVPLLLLLINFLF